jgi:LysM repeat protein
MKTPVSTVRATIVTFFAVLGLIANLSGCSTPAARQDVPPPVSPPAAAETQQPQATQKIRVKENHPVQYVVKKGDTLWDIASLFLKDPWYWPEIWQRNPQIKNPHLIYPGDVLTLIYVNGQPQILVNQTTTQSGTQAVENNLPVVKLGPTVHRSKIDASIPTIPGDAIRQFLTRPRVVTKKQMESAPYVIGSPDDHLILGHGNEVFIRGELDKERVRYTVFRPGDKLIDPKTGDLLGYEAIYAGEVRIKKYGDPATGVLTSTAREVLIGDRLLPMDKSSQSNLYFPKLPDREEHGQIISLFDALFGVAKYQIAVINLGASDGLEVGNLLATYRRGDTLRDEYDPTDKGRMVKMPDERSGLMMIFRAFDRVSYGLVMESTNVIHKYDLVATPQ